MTLDEFIQASLLRFATNRHSRAHVDEPGFETLYVRLGRRVLMGIVRQPVLDIATVTVDEAQRGRGRFTKLIDRVRDMYPALHLYVENAMEPRFQKHLERYGFTIVEPRLDPPCYFLPAVKGM
jgi:hypothetical protein